MIILCKMSSKCSKYLVLVVNGVFVSFDRFVIERVAMTFGFSNIDLSNMNVGDELNLM